MNVSRDDSGQNQLQLVRWRGSGLLNFSKTIIAPVAIAIGGEIKLSFVQFAKLL